MEILHRISINSKKEPELVAMVMDLGLEHHLIELPGEGGKLVTFVIDEANKHWLTITNLIDVSQKSGMVETVFSEDEIKRAEWLRLRSTFEQGYPQPKALWPTKQLSYEIICPACATYKQINPMRLAKEPHLGKNSFMSLIWAGEIFCVPNVIQGLEGIKATGYEAWNAVIHKTSLPSERVCQLYIAGIASPGLINKEDLVGKTCPTCGIIKYYPHVKGIMRLRREALLPNTDIMLTHEWFGSGLIAWREILVSNRIARLILDRGWQGIRFKVIEMV